MFVSRPRLALVLAVALLAAACTGTSGTTTTVAPTTTTAATTATTAATTTTAEPIPAPTGVLRIATDGDLGGIWDPHLTPSPFATPLLMPVYEPLIRFVEGELSPGIATAWEFVDGGLGLEVTLREGVTFQDGNALDADAVVANFERSLGIEGSAVVPNLLAVESVERVDDLTVRFTLSEPNTALPGLLADRAGMMISPAAFDNPDLDVLGVGAGPYVLDENQPGAFLRLTAYDGYWDPTMNRVAEIQIEILDPEAARNAFLDGRLDVIDIAPDEITQFETDGYRVEVFTGAEVQVMYLNKTGALADERVRRAISLAIDRQGLSQALTAGTCAPTGQIFGFGTVPYDESIAAPTQDLTAAQALMDEAEVSELTIDMVTFPFDTTAESLIPMLAEIGITLNIEKVFPPELPELFATGEREAYYTRLSGHSEPAVTLSILTGRFNPGGLEDDVIAALAAETAQETDPAVRADQFRQINDRMTEIMWNAPVCNVAVPLAYQTHVEHFGLNSLNAFDWYDITVSS